MKWGNLLPDVGELGHDIVKLHPIGALEDLPAGKFLLGTSGKFARNIIQATEEFPTGIYTLAKTAYEDPGSLPDLFKQMGVQTLEDFRHPLRRPGYTFLDALGLLPVVGAPLRLAEAASIAGRAGELPAWAKAAQANAAEKAAQLVEKGGVGAAEQAKLIEKAAVPGIHRMVDPATGLPRSVQSQVLSTIFRGQVREARPLKIPRMEGNSGFDTPAGVSQYGWYYSKDPLIKAAQKMIDKMYDTHPELSGNPIWRMTVPGFQRSQSGRISSAAKAEINTVRKEASTLGAAYLKKWQKTTPEDWITMRLVGEGTTPSDLMRMHQDALDSGEMSPKQRLETERRMELIPRVAAERIDVTPVEVNGRMVDRSVLKPQYAEANPTMVDFINDSRELSHARDYASIVTGVLRQENAYNRMVGPYEFAKTGKLPVSITKINQTLGQLSRNPAKNKKRIAELERVLAEAHGQQSLLDPLEANADVPMFFKDAADRAEFAKKAELFRVPYSFDRDPFLKVGAYNVFRQRFKGGKPRVPGTYTHPFTAAIMKTGGGAENTARLLAESYTEAQRYHALRMIRDRLVLSSQATPEGIPEDQRQLIRTGQLASAPDAADAMRIATKQNLPKGIDVPGAESIDLLGGGEARLSEEQLIGGGRMFEGIRKFIFPDKDNTSASALGLIKEDFDKLLGRNGQEFQPVPGWGWINKSQLGDLNKSNPLVGLYEKGLARKAVKTTDWANSVLKSMMLFLRPAYLVPNLIGNVFLNLIQQGAFMPLHMMKNWMTWRGLSKAERTMVDSQMGKGIGGMLGGERGRPGFSEAPMRFAEKAGRFYGRFMDDPFRRNAFLHEAAVQGFDSPARLRKLLKDPNYDTELRDITTAANDEIISYDRLGPGEDQIMRRLILFYPFTKGASRYAVNLAKSHPGASGVLGAEGSLGTQVAEKAYGKDELPAFMRGLIPVRSRGGGIWDTISPLSTSPLAAPADLASQILDLGSPHPSKYLSLVQNFSPAEGAILSGLSGGRTATISRPPGSPLGPIATQELIGGLPPIAMFNILRGRSAVAGDPSQSVFPDTDVRRAIQRYFAFGGGQPRQTNIPLAQWREWMATGQPEG